MPKAKLNPKLRYIYRQESSRNRLRGWQVLYSRGLDKRICCYFGDNTYGGKEQALSAAIAFRDKVLALHAPPEPLTLPKAQRRLKVANKPSELIGVRIALAKKAVKGVTHIYNWTGYAMVDGKLKNKSWAIHKWGYETAFWNAAKHRQSLTGQPLPMAVPEPPLYLIEWARDLEEQGIFVFAKSAANP